jgi:hypothetical protein
MPHPKKKPRRFFLEQKGHTEDGLQELQVFDMKGLTEDEVVSTSGKNVELTVR